MNDFIHRGWMVTGQAFITALPMPPETDGSTYTHTGERWVCRADWRRPRALQALSTVRLGDLPFLLHPPLSTEIMTEAAG